MEGDCSSKKKVCVTGAGGYVASWLVKVLLSKGYTVHGTARDPCDEKKNGHLKNLENALENLQLFKTDLLDYEGLCAAIVGCMGVFHVASPVPDNVSPVANPEEKLLVPAVEGTRNVLNACLKAGVRKVIVVSSAGANMVNPNWPMDQDIDESCWTDTEYCRSTKNWYCLAKTIAEKEAWLHAKESGLDIVTICPSIVIGPMLQSTANASSLHILRYMKGSSVRVDNREFPLVDVRDLAKGILMLYENNEAKGRYICSSFGLRIRELVDKLQCLFPDYKYSTSFAEVQQLNSWKLNSQKLQSLGWVFKPLEETLKDVVKDYEEHGLLAN
ncbi:Cinnamoyl-CoA reductase [Heracleum sosnowskyi]|uniref:Cinnamoyl-CoA reductase n=1 Tax=Heracleum sosnowskyi TaxID=360622 RepID=A0AAD8IPQ2_9APIA|nr:Cinnamoyl-CoA reductase [Heracleum sosnowskyi]